MPEDLFMTLVAQVRDERLRMLLLHIHEEIRHLREAAQQLEDARDMMRRRVYGYVTAAALLLLSERLGVTLPPLPF